RKRLGKRAPHPRNLPLLGRFDVSLKVQTGLPGFEWSATEPPSSFFDGAALQPNNDAGAIRWRERVGGLLWIPVIGRWTDSADRLLRPDARDPTAISQHRLSIA